MVMESHHLSCQTEEILTMKIRPWIIITKILGTKLIRFKTNTNKRLYLGNFLRTNQNLAFKEVFSIPSRVPLIAQVVLKLSDHSLTNN